MQTESGMETGTRNDVRETPTAMRALLGLGQSVWLDYLRRGMTRSGELASLVADGLRGMTSNPSIFEHALAGSADYDEALAQLGASRQTDREVFETLVRLGYDGEEMRTEISAKFRREVVENELAAAGLVLEAWWTDAAGDFALSLARR